VKLLWRFVPNGDCDAGQARRPLRAGGRRCLVHVIIISAAGRRRQAAERRAVDGPHALKWRNGFAVGATFEGEFCNVTRSYAGKGIVGCVW
jgi:hypothetical protein